MVTKVKKRPSSDEVQKLLLEGNFGLSAGDPLPLTDPISTTQLVLTLNDVKPYDKNPRRERNPAYEEIKDSIRSKKQLNNNFNVTRRPGDDLYMVESGGNTRLAILKELYLETADEVFNTIHCLFVPWKSESSILTAHLIENEIRGDMLLIDKAYAAQELKREFELECGEVISDREFTRLAAVSGYKISSKLLRRFNYAIELDQMIPLVLRSGLGGHKIDHIKKVEKAYRQYCKDKTEQFEAAFTAVMSESNQDEAWDFDRTRLELDDRLSDLTGVRYNLLRLEVDAILFDQNLATEALNHPKDHQAADIDKLTEASTLTSNQDNQLKNTTTGQVGPSSKQIEESNIDIDEAHLKSVALENTVTTKPGLTDKDQKTQLKMLRQKGYDLACNIARTAGIEDVVIQSNCGLGFFMESPHQSLVTDSQCYFNWWLLFGISEQNVNNETHYPMWAFTDLYSQFGEHQRHGDDSIVNNIGSDPGVSQLMYEFLHKQEFIIDQTFTNIFRLMENCRKIRSHFHENHIWEEQL